MARTSTKQQYILEFLRAFTAENGYAPSVREICAAVGLRSTASVHYHLAELKRQGQIDIDENKNRAITLSEAHQPGRIPIIGTVAAGMPILAQENIEGYLPWDGEDTCFALRVQGYSMINAGILDGDHVVVRPQSTADTGDIVVALLDDEATVKRFRRDTHGGIWLLPENPDYQPLDGRYAKILGKVKAVYREY